VSSDGGIRALCKVERRLRVPMVWPRAFETHAWRIIKTAARVVEMKTTIRARSPKLSLAGIFYASCSNTYHASLPTSDLIFRSGLDAGR